MKIDLGRSGPAGIEASFEDGVLFVGGSNHWRDWAHHFLPGARRREIVAATEIMKIIGALPVRIVAGHSMGAAVACIVAAELERIGEDVQLYVYGGKRAPRIGATPTKAYRRRGDIVPWLPPWRPRYDNHVFGDRTWPGDAHNSYYGAMRMDGVK